jgi:tape measure domain-containing protein
MANFPLKYIYEIVDRYTPAAKRMAGATKRFQRQLKVAARVNRDFRKQLKKSGATINKFGKSLSLKLSAPLALLGGLALRASSQFETMRTSFVGILGDADKAGALVERLAEFTAKTPFQLDQVASSAKKLLAAGFSDATISNQLQLIGDLSAAANVPLNDIAAIFAKIKNKGKAMTEEILQMSDRGIPIIAVLAEQFKVTKEQVFELAQTGRISFSLIEGALKKMTREGGFAHKAMILQSKTLSGVVSTLRDNLFLLSKQVGDVFLEDVKSLAIKMISLAQATAAWVKNNPRLAKMALIGGLILASFGPVLIVVGQMAMGLSAIIPIITFLTPVVSAAAAAILGLSVSIGAVSIPLLPLIFMIGGLTAAFIQFRNRWQELKTIDFGLVFKGMLLSFQETFPKIFNFFGAMFDKISQLGGLIKGFFGSNNSLKLVEERKIDTSGLSTQKVAVNNQSSVDINLNSPSGVIKSVATQGDNVNLGMNMVGAQ